MSEKNLQWVTISDCPPERSEEFWETEQDAQKAIDLINETGCGGQCKGKRYHYIINLDQTQMPPNTASS